MSRENPDTVDGPKGRGKHEELVFGELCGEAVYIDWEMVVLVHTWKMNEHREPCAHSDVVRSSLPFNSGDECLWGWSRGGGLHVIVAFGLGAKWCDGVRNKRVLVLMWSWQCLGHKVIAKHMCDHDVTCTRTRSHGYGFLPGQNICTRTPTLGKTRRLPGGLPIPMQYTSCTQPMYISKGCRSSDMCKAKEYY